MEIQQLQFHIPGSRPVELTPFGDTPRPEWFDMASHSDDEKEEKQNGING